MTGEEKKTKPHLHLIKVIGGWIPYVAGILVCILFPHFVKQNPVTFSEIAFGIGAVQRVIIDSIEYFWEKEH